MKRAVAFLMCFVILTLAAVSVVSSYDSGLIDARNLVEYGQKHYYLGSPSLSLPDVSDGLIGTDEYSYSYSYFYGEPTVELTDKNTAAKIMDSDSADVYMSYTEDSFYAAIATNDKNYIRGKDAASINIGLTDSGATPYSISRICFDIEESEETEGEAVVKARFLIKNYDGTWKPIVNNDGSEFVREASARYNKDTGCFAVEAEFDLVKLMSYFENDNAIEDARMYFTPYIMMYGESEAGAGDVVCQGVLWNYLPSNINNEIKLRFMIDYPDRLYYPTFFPNIVHFCDKPDVTETPTTIYLPNTYPNTCPSDHPCTVPPVSSNSVIDVRDIGAYGQAHYYIGNALLRSTPDVSDGKIYAGEYNASFKFGIENKATTFIIDKPTDVSHFSTDTVRFEMSYDSENLYIAAKVKDTEYYAGYDALSVDLGLKNGGTGSVASERIRFVFKESENGEDDFHAYRLCYIGISREEEIPFYEFVNDASFTYDKPYNTYTVEFSIPLKHMLSFYENGNTLSGLRMYFLPRVCMYGDTAAGKSDGPVMQGILCHALDTRGYTELKDRLVAELTDSYCPEMLPHIIHFCKDSEVPDYSALTEGPIEEYVPRASNDLEAEINISKEITKRSKRTKDDDDRQSRSYGCGATIGISAIVSMTLLSVAVVMAKKKED